MAPFKYIIAGLASLFSFNFAQAKIVVADKVYIQNSQDLDIVIQEFTGQPSQSFTEDEKSDLLKVLKSRGLVEILHQGKSTDTTGWQTTI
ncbi:MAG: hypothetical protein ACKOX6_14185 [Bdellovibrio sp.]